METDGTFDANATTLADIVRAKNDYGIWALNTLHSHYAVANSLPMRLVKGSVVRNTVPYIDREEFARVLGSFDSDQLGNPLAVFGAIKLDIDCKDLSEIAHDLSENMFLSAGAYANPVFTLLRRSSAWRMAELISLEHLLRKWHREGKPAGGFVFDDPLAKYFFLTVKELPCFDAFLVAGPCWRWQKPDRNGRAIGREVTANGINLLLKAFQERATAHDEANPADQLEAIAQSKEQLMRLGSVRAAITPGDAIARLTKTAASYEMASQLKFHDWPEQATSRKEMNDRVQAWLEKSKLGINHWQGLAVLTAVLSRDTYLEKELPDGHAGVLFYYPPSLHERNLESRTPKYVRAEQRQNKSGDKTWKIDFRDVPDRDQYEKDESSRLLLPSGSPPGSFVRALSTALSRKVDRNHTNRHSFLDERITLLRYQLADMAAEVISSGKQSKKVASIDELDSLSLKSTSHMNVRLPERFASNIAYSLGADVCRIYRFNYVSRRLDTIQAHYGPAILSDLGETECNDLENLFVSQAANHPEIRKRCIPYLVLDGGHEHEELGGIRGVCFNTIEKDRFVWPSGLPDDVAGRCAIAVPILIFGRIWGVLEVRARFPRQLRQSTQLWLTEISRTIGSSLFNEWIDQHVSDLINQASKILRSPEDLDVSIYEIVANELISLFLCDSCLIWYHHPTEAPNFHVCGGKMMHGTTDMWSEFFGQHPEHFSCSVDEMSATDTGSLTKTFIEEGVSFAQYCLSEETGKWVSGPICKKLQNLNQTKVCLLRLEDEFGDAQGAIWLAGKYEFSEAWKQLLPSIAAQLRLVFDIALGRHRLLSKAQQTLAHEAASALQVIQRNNEELEAGLAPIIGDNPREMSGLLAALRQQVRKDGGFDALNVANSERLFTELEGIFAKAKQQFSAGGGKYDELREAIYRIREKSESAKRHVDDLMQGRAPDVEYKARSAINFLRVLDTTIDLERKYATPVRGGSDSSYNARSAKPIWLGQTSNIDIVFPRREADFVLSNLISNAIKYNIGIRPPRIEYRVLVKEDLATHIFSFKNVGWRILDNETDRIFAWTTRGQYAADFWPESGIGAGLAGVVYRLRRISESNAHIDASLGGPVQKSISLPQMGEVKMSHPSVLLFRKANPELSLNDRFTEIEFVLTIRNIGRINKHGVIL